MTVPTVEDILAEIAKASYGPSDEEGHTMRELETIGRAKGLGRRRVHEGVRACVTSGKAQVVMLHRKDLSGRDQRVIGYKFL